MTTYVLVHGAASDSSDWREVAPALRARGHEVITPDLPCADDSAGFEEYADAVVEAIGGRRGVILVAHSLAGFTAPLVCARIPIDLLVLVTAMIPLPGETVARWWHDSGQHDAKRALAEREGRPDDDDLDAVFLHDVPAELVAWAKARPPVDQSGTPFDRPWPLSAWPDVPTKYVLCRDDRLFPADFVRRHVARRLGAGVVPDEIDSGHYPALANPTALVDLLDSYRAETAGRTV